MKKKVGVFLYAVLAGMAIGIGGSVFLSQFSNRIVGTFLFTVGLFTICSFGLNLFTGKVCYVFDNPPSYIIDLVIIWLGNLCGTFIMAFILSLTRLGGTFAANAAELAAVKNSDSLLSLFLLGLVCNMLIYIAVEGYKTIPHELGKYLALIFGVMVFILIGTEHSVADMFYYAAAGELFTADAITRLVIITAGNAVGGVIFPLGKKLKEHLDK